MSYNAKTIAPEALAVEGASLLQKHKIQALLVKDADGELVGALNFQDLLQAGVV